MFAALGTKIVLTILAVLVIFVACAQPTPKPYFETTIATITETTTTEPETTTEATTTETTTTTIITTTTTTTVPPVRAHNTMSTLTPPPGLEIVNNRPINMVTQRLTGTATAYYWRGLTATGVYARSGFVAVDPRVIPYGSHLWIVSDCGNFNYGYAVAVDTGGFANRANPPIVDIHVYDPALARRFGRRGVTVYILDKPRVRLPWNQSWPVGEVYSHRLRRGAVTDAMLNANS